MIPKTSGEDDIELEEFTSEEPGLTSEEVFVVVVVEVEVGTGVGVGVGVIFGGVGLAALGAALSDNQNC